MPNSIAGLVGGVGPSIVPPGSGIGIAPDTPTRSVQLTSGETAHLNPSHPHAARHADILGSLRNRRIPIYLQVSDQRTILDVRLPKVGRVVQLTDTPRGLRVDLDTSGSRHVLPPHLATPEVVHLLQRSLREGQLVMVVKGQKKTDVLDVRQAPAELEALFPPLHALPPTDDLIASLSEIDEAEAEQRFAEMQARACDVAAGTPGCIPFLYSQDGCVPRAHEMCRMLKQHNIVAGKIWIFGDLAPFTPNDPDCFEEWGLHVAPIVRLRGAGELFVIDPAVFARPVSRTTWESAMNSPNAETALTDASIYIRSKPGGGRRENDPHNGITETEDYLEFCRKQLRRMDPPPPFAHCTLNPPPTD